MSNEINFIDPHLNESDKILFLGPLEESDGPFIPIEDNWIIAHVMHHAGIFTSVKEAKRNGCNIPIPKGFHDVTVGKKKLRIITMTVFD